MTTPRFVMLLATVALTTIAGCTDATTSPSTTATSPNTTTPPATVTITPTTAAPAIEALLDLLGPCGVITDAQAQAVGYAGHTDPSTGDRTSCTYTAADSPRQLTISISKIRLTTQSGLPGDTVTAENAGNHQGVRVQSGTEPACAFYLDAANRTVMVQATREENSVQACMRARAVAERMARAVL